jgi:predicted amidophosphoribosyltransferase
MEFRCPYCQAPIYSRKNKICGVCEKPLPKELLMSDAEITFWKKEMDQEEKRAKEFDQQMNDVGPHDGHGGIGGIAGF